MNNSLFSFDQSKITIIKFFIINLKGDTREAHVRWEPQVEGMMRIEASFPQYETKVIEPVGAKKHVEG